MTMSQEYVLSYTAEQIDEKLGKVDNALLFAKQTLTEKQQAQARANIGVGETDDTFKRKGNIFSTFATSFIDTVISLNGSRIDTYENVAGWRTHKIPVRAIDGLDYYLSYNGNPISARVALYDVNNEYIPNTYKDGSTGKISITQDGYIYISANLASNNLLLEVGTEYKGETEFYLESDYPVRIENEELTDIRVGYDGTNYDTAGNAVRAQVSQLNDKISESVITFTRKGNIFTLAEKLGNYILGWENGKIEDWNNELYTTYKIPVRVIDGMDYYLSFGGSTLPAYVALYDVNDMYIPNTYVANKSLGKISITQDGYIHLTIGRDATTALLEVGDTYKGETALYLVSDRPVGKKVAVLGDSITVGWTENSDGTNGRYMPVRWHDYIRKRYGFESVTVDAEIGRSFVRNGSMSTRFTEKVEQIATDTDIIFVFGGINDFGLGSALGTIDDAPSKANGAEETQKFYPAVKYCAEYLTTHFPNADIIFMTPLQENAYGGGINRKNESGHRNTDYIDAIKEVCRMYGIYCIEMGLTSEFKVASTEWLAKYMPDGLHPNEAGTALYVQNCLYNKLDEYFCR